MKLSWKQAAVVVTVFAVVGGMFYYAGSKRREKPDQLPGTLPIPALKYSREECRVLATFAKRYSSGKPMRVSGAIHDPAFSMKTAGRVRTAVVDFLGGDEEDLPKPAGRTIRSWTECMLYFESDIQQTPLGKRWWTISAHSGLVGSDAGLAFATHFALPATELWPERKIYPPQLSLRDIELASLKLERQVLVVDYVDLIERQECASLLKVLQLLSQNLGPGDVFELAACDLITNSKNGPMTNLFLEIMINNIPGAFVVAYDRPVAWKRGQLVGGEPIAFVRGEDGLPSGEVEARPPNKG